MVALLDDQRPAVPLWCLPSYNQEALFDEKNSLASALAEAASRRVNEVEGKVALKRSLWQEQSTLQRQLQEEKLIAQRELHEQQLVAQRELEKEKSVVQREMHANSLETQLRIAGSKSSALEASAQTKARAILDRTRLELLRDFVKEHPDDHNAAAKLRESLMGPT